MARTGEMENVPSVPRFPRLSPGSPRFRPRFSQVLQVLGCGRWFLRSAARADKACCSGRCRMRVCRAGKAADHSDPAPAFPMRAHL